MIPSLSPGVTPVDALSRLKAHAEEPVYFHTDHHWTADGAYYGYAAFMEARGLQPLPLS
ncbi:MULTISPECIES: DHHW family protein [Paenibacillus]|uniref:DHHW family protein n=1 Tax=Paenibacillus TaxID=44249 RepID=UPI0022B8DAC8|nr:DHHW family protein [Paenibacillus caseinilyticus]MCZ8521078.1 DHHW family protein [Paenibacillus caseinilyticus]